MCAWKKPYGWHYADRRQIVGVFTIPVSEFEKRRNSFPVELLDDVQQLERKIDSSGLSHFEVVVLKTSPKFSSYAARGNLHARGLRAASVVETMFLVHSAPQLKGRIVLSIESKWRVANGDVDSYWGLDFRGDLVTIDTFAVDILKMSRTAYASTSW